MILSNQAKCLLCGDEPYSAFTHDFKHCKCREIFVDGGMSYFRGGFTKRENFLDLSITLEELPCEMIMSAVEWAGENNRNSLGYLCAIARALRDCGYEIKEVNPAMAIQELGER